MCTMAEQLDRVVQRAERRLHRDRLNGRERFRFHCSARVLHSDNEERREQDVSTPRCPLFGVRFSLSALSSEAKDERCRY